MAEIAKCNKCGRIYDDPESIELVKQWKVASNGDGYAPCPNMDCHGQMEIVQATRLLGCEDCELSKFNRCPVLNKAECPVNKIWEATNKVIEESKTTIAEVEQFLAVTK